MSRVRRDLAEVTRKRRAKQRDYWLRCIGYATRPLVYFGPMAILVWWLWPHAVALSQSPDSLALTDLLLIGGCIIGFFGVAVPLTLFFFNIDRDPIDWEDWGKVGLGLVPVAALAVLWFV